MFLRCNKIKKGRKNDEYCISVKHEKASTLKGILTFYVKKNAIKVKRKSYELQVYNMLFCKNPRNMLSSLINAHYLPKNNIVSLDITSEH